MKTSIVSILPLLLAGSAIATRLPGSVEASGPVTASPALSASLLRGGGRGAGGASASGGPPRGQKQLLPRRRDLQSTTCYQTTVAVFSATNVTMDTTEISCADIDDTKAWYCLEPNPGYQCHSSLESAKYNAEWGCTGESSDDYTSRDKNDDDSEYHRDAFFFKVSSAVQPACPSKYPWQFECCYKYL
jgi:hypothetical protein